MAAAADGKVVETVAPVLKFTVAHEALTKSLETAFQRSAVDMLVDTYHSLATSDQDNKKLILDQCFREFMALDGHGATSVDIERTKQLVLFAIQAAKKEICNSMTPIQVLADVLDILPLSSCELLFKVIEQEVSTWRSPTFFITTKNGLLRICNDLLRRLSRTQNTVFCGRILLFLAKFFPFSERSGLNVVSEFNLDNYTAYSKEAPIKKAATAAEPVHKEEEEGEEAKIEVEGDPTENGAAEAKEPAAAPKEGEETGKEEEEVESMEIELPDEEKLKLELENGFELYSKFWQLQDYFRNPTQCYSKEQWAKFCTHTADLVHAFENQKLENHSQKKEDVVKNKDQASDYLDQYFAKYLTNQNLLSLQLNDANFRRYVLVQFLILFQYLQTSVKFKLETQVLSSEQTKWIDDKRKKVYKLMDDIPPNGKVFSQSLKAILKRELIWIRWKNDGCPSFVIKKTEEKAAAPESSEKAKPRKRKASLGELMKHEAKSGRLNLGNKGLTKLWNLNPDNLGACKQEERNFLPSLNEYFGDAIEEIDPKNQVEESYKKVNNGEWGWRALRLMSRRSQHFFLVGNSQISKLPEYLEMMMTKMAEDFGRPINRDSDSMDVSEAVNGGDNNGAKKEEEAAAGSAKLTEDQLSTLAVKLADHWETLVPKFGLPEEEVEKCKTEEANEAKCLRLLNSWVEAEGEGCTPDEISYIVGGLKLSHLIDGVF